MARNSTITRVSLVDSAGRGGGAAQAGAALDERVRRSKQVVLATTFKLMQEGGIGGVSVDEVSRRSGVAKTTIYRHWSSRAALLMDACSKLRPRGEAPDTGSLDRDLNEHLLNFARRLQAPGWPSILPSIIDAAERDPELARLQSQLFAGFRQPLYTVFENARKRGELSPRENPAELVAALSGPLVFRRWMSREQIDGHFVRNVVSSFIRSFGLRKRR